MFATSISISRILAYSLLFLQLVHVTEAGRFSKLCKSLNCFGKEDNLPIPLPPYKYVNVVCPNPEAPKGAVGWAISTSRGPLPTVAEIVADIKLCGILTAETNLILYSYGAGRTAAENFRDRNPELNGKLITTVMPDGWIQALGAKFPDTAKADSPAQIAWNYRLSQALAKAAQGAAYVLTSATANIYTTPYTDTGIWAWRGPHNVFYNVELGTLQQNPAITAIYTVNANTLVTDERESASWVRGGHGQPAESNVNADTITPASIQQQIDDYNARQCPPEGSNAQTRNAKRAAKSTRGGAVASGAACSFRPRATLTTSAPSTLATRTRSAKATGSARETSIKKATRSAKPTSIRKATGAAKPTSIRKATRTAKAPNPPKATQTKKCKGRKC